MNWKSLSPALLFAALALHSSARAQTYPTHVIKMVVPAGAAGPTDLLGRLIANELSNTLGQTVIIENHPGAGGAIGARDVAKATPDGYTLLVGNTATLATIPAVSKNASYDPLKDFAGVAKIMDSFQLLLVRPDLPVKSVQELIAYAKADPGKLNYAAVGAGNITHLSAELLKKKTGIDFLVVQYKRRRRSDERADGQPGRFRRQQRDSGPAPRDKRQAAGACGDQREAGAWI